MLNKRDFLRGGAAALAGSAAAGTALASSPQRLDASASLAAWQAQLGRAFEVEGHALTLQAVQSSPGTQPGEQFSLGFVGALPADLGDGLRELRPAGGPALALYLARTPQGLRADFCRLPG